VTVVPLALLLFVLDFLPPSHVRVGAATVYWPGDGQCGNERADGRSFDATDDHIAHRSLPIGTAGWLCSKRTGLCRWTQVRDRGPFGQIRPCDEESSGRIVRWVPWSKRKGCWRWRVHTRPRPGWRYRGEFDLTRPVARAVGHRAFEQVSFFYWKLPKLEPDT
jgi:hypothetical protein